MTKRFAVNIMGYLDDVLDKYTADQIERMISANAVMSFSSVTIVGVTAKELPPDVTSLDAKKAKKFYGIKK